jgi:diaminohydroxyphosphoribosylaminopyrimidine deaminase/5-amino-6-(5-phosphoribosylamino)uracil reductase
VVVGVGDPNPLVAAAGIATLQAAGIKVSLVGGPEEQQCYSINEEFMDRMKAAATSGSSST